jgi:iron only hydrogenase large subunit-like protein
MLLWGLLRTGELLSQLSASNKAVVVSLSPQSRASLAAYYGLTPLQAFKKLTGFLKSLGVKAVFDTSCSRDLSLVESCAEFVERFRTKKNFPILASSCPGKSLCVLIGHNCTMAIR